MGRDGHDDRIYIYLASIASHGKITKHFVLHPSDLCTSSLDLDAKVTYKVTKCYPQWCHLIGHIR